MKLKYLKKMEKKILLHLMISNEHIEDFDTASIIIDIVANPFKFQTEYKEFIKQDEGK